MNYLVDTNVISEIMQRSPDPGVSTWFLGVDEDVLFLSVITVGEIRRGIERLMPGIRRNNLETWLTESVVDRFAGRLLPVDHRVAEEWGRVLARCEASGRRADIVDAQIAATALCHDLTVVTRNVKDFEATGVAVHNPWLG